jgi:hypothetical protein
MTLSKPEELSTNGKHPENDNRDSASDQASATKQGDKNQICERLKTLFDYTKFHIGLYTTVGAAYIALMTSDYGKKFLTPNKPLVILAVIALLIAGMAGGIIASSCCHETDFDKFMKTHLTPFAKEERLWAPTARHWTNIEHGAFWVAIIVAVLSFNIIPLGGIPLLTAEKPISVELSTVGDSIILEWTTPPGSAGTTYNVVDFGRPRHVLLCGDFVAASDLQAKLVAGSAETVSKTANQVFECKAVEVNRVSVVPQESKSLKGKIVLLEK